MLQIGMAQGMNMAHNRLPDIVCQRRREQQANRAVKNRSGMMVMAGIEKGFFRDLLGVIDWLKSHIAPFGSTDRL